jgi:D-3-phosphoglycerate dehydrogenase / 2-oxoglutarate reductase
MKVVVTDSGELLQPGIDRLREHGVEVEVLAGGDFDVKVEALRRADAVLVGAEPLTAAELDRMGEGPGFVVRAGVGYDVIDLPAASRHGMQVANVPDYCTDEVADHTLALLLAAARRLPYFLSSWRTRGWVWSGDDVPVPRMADLTLGLVGAGRIGRAVAARAAGFGMRVLTSDPIPPGDLPCVDLPTLLGGSDIVSLHCPYVPATHHLMTDGTFDFMRPGSILVNTSRGSIVNGEALLRALERDQPALACLDVLEGEPTPDLSHPLLNHPRVLVTPHVAYYSVASKRKLSIFAADNILRYLNGSQPVNVVNRPT